MKLLKLAIRQVIGNKFSASERRALRLLAEQLVKHRILFSTALVIQALTAFLDVSSIAILGLAINLFAATEIDNSMLTTLPMGIQAFLGDQSPDVAILILVGGALVSQLLSPS